MAKYILPIVNCIVICSLSLLLNFRDGTPMMGVIFTAIILVITIYLINLVRKNGNEIKINAINKIMTLLSFVLIAGNQFEIITGNRISDGTGDIIAALLVIVGICIWLYDYCVKPLKNNK